jgi:hypothetical protein
MDVLAIPNLGGHAFAIVNHVGGQISHPRDALDGLHQALAIFA